VSDAAEPAAPAHAGGSKRLLVALPVAAAVTAIVVALTPSDVMLGSSLRLVLFHGASTWVNLAAFTLTALASIVFLATRRTGLVAWAGALRWVALGLWVVNTTLGVISMRITWGGFLWSEPRLQMTFWVLLAALVIVMTDLLAERPRLTAVLDVVFVAGLWTVLARTPNLMHPNSPVFHSTDIKIPAFFIAIVLTWGVTMAIVTALVRRRVAAPADKVERVEPT
jgi:hypothetical protein